MYCKTNTLHSPNLSFSSHFWLIANISLLHWSSIQQLRKTQNISSHFFLMHKNVKIRFAKNPVLQHISQRSLQLVIWLITKWSAHLIEEQRRRPFIHDSSWHVSWYVFRFLQHSAPNIPCSLTLLANLEACSSSHRQRLLSILIPSVAMN